MGIRGIIQVLIEEMLEAIQEVQETIREDLVAIRVAATRARGAAIQIGVTKETLLLGITQVRIWAATLLAASLRVECMGDILSNLTWVVLIMLATMGTLPLITMDRADKGDKVTKRIDFTLK